MVGDGYSSRCVFVCVLGLRVVRFRVRWVSIFFQWGGGGSGSGYLVLEQEQAQEVVG